MSWRRIHRALMLTLLLVVPEAAIGAEDTALRPFSFAVIGDVPYYPYEEAYLKNLLATLGRERIEFIVHVGDIKSAASRCDDLFYATRADLFATSPRPFVLVPGDNDWLACTREVAGGYDATERLRALRKFFFQGNVSLGTQVMQVDRQTGDRENVTYAEHARWMVGPVVFLTLNVPGGGNHFGTAEAQERMRAVSAWLHAGFKRARAVDAPGIVIFFHGDPRFEVPAGSPRRRGYEEFLDALASEARQFDKPVLLVHGDRHGFTRDRPLNTGPRPLPKVMRVSTFGSPDVKWIRISVDPGTENLFRIEPQDGAAEVPR